LQKDRPRLCGIDFAARCQRIGFLHTGMTTLSVRILRLFLPFWTVTVVSASTPPPDFLDAAAKFQSNEALALLEKSTLGDPVFRDLSRALILLNVQPKTEGNISRSAALLESVAATVPGTDQAALALYHLARIEEVHRKVPDRARAVERYETLLRLHPGSREAEIGFVKMANILLYSQATPDERRAQFARFEETGRTLAFPPARRSFHMSMADAYARHGFSAGSSLRHLLAFVSVPLEEKRDIAPVLYRIARLSEATGNPVQAALFYNRLIDEYPRDNRVFEARQRLATLGGKKR
jgi:tetratricopeptide (TPR) repeat protein